MTTWPTLDELKAELRLSESGDDAVVQQALDAAIDYVTSRVRPDAIVSVTPPNPTTPPSIGAGMYEATIMLGARYYRRRDSLDGTIGWGTAGVIRVGGRDPDVEALLTQYLAVVVG